jgi:hypothetical protein
MPGGQRQDVLGQTDNGSRLPMPSPRFFQANVDRSFSRPVAEQARLSSSIIHVARINILWRASLRELAGGGKSDL